MFALTNSPMPLSANSRKPKYIQWTMIEQRNIFHFSHLQSWNQQMFDTKPENQWMNPLVVRFAGFIRCQSTIIVSAHRRDVVGGGSTVNSQNFWRAESLQKKSPKANMTFSRGQVQINACQKFRNPVSGYIDDPGGEKRGRLSGRIKSRRGLALWDYQATPLQCYENAGRLGTQAQARAPTLTHERAR